MPEDAEPFFSQLADLFKKDQAEAERELHEAKSKIHESYVGALNIDAAINDPRIKDNIKTWLEVIRTLREIHEMSSLSLYEISIQAAGKDYTCGHHDTADWFVDASERTRFCCRDCFMQLELIKALVRTANGHLECELCDKTLGKDVPADPQLLFLNMNLIPGNTLNILGLVCLPCIEGVKSAIQGAGVRDPE